jgi:Flagellar motor protein
LLRQLGGVAINAPLFSVYDKSQQKIQQLLLKKLQDQNNTLIFKLIIEFHTHNLPLPPKKRFRYNSQLSSTRSLNIVKLLKNKTFIPPNNFSTFFYNKYKPTLYLKNLKTNQKKRKTKNINKPLKIILTSNTQHKSKITHSTFHINLKKYLYILLF